MLRKAGAGQGGMGSGSGRLDGRGRSRSGAGPGGYCVCPQCGEKIIHRRGVACTSLECTKCGSSLVRDSS